MKRVTAARWQRVRLALGIGIATSLLATSHAALAQTFTSGSNGSDGAFSPTCLPSPCTVSIALPPSGIFNFTTLTVPTGVTVKFTRNPTNTPAVILATGDVLVAGTIDVSGGRGGDGLGATSLLPTAGAGGPGGFDGGNGSNGIDAAANSLGGAGLGPGGGVGNCGGSFGGPGDGCGTVIYGTPSLVPLIGGSGGGGTNTGFGGAAPGGGGGGGAILIASSGTLTLTGAIVSRGGAGGNSPSVFVGAGGGSGGAVHLAATTIVGSSGRLDVRGGSGGTGSTGGRSGGIGRIRVEALVNSAAINFNGVVPSFSVPSALVFLTTPTLTITAVAGVPAPPTPSAMYVTPDIVLPPTATSPVAVTLAASNIPPGTSVTVSVIGRNGGSSSATATLTGTLVSSTASTSVAIRTVEPSIIMATTSFTLTAARGAPRDVDDEGIERVMVSTALGGVSRLSYITTPGHKAAAVDR
jgi:hypothetical protein